MVSALLTIALVLMLADPATAQSWTLRVDGVGCVTAADIPVDCADGSATHRVVDYTVLNAQGGTDTTGSLKVPKTMSKLAVRNSLRHVLHQRKYPSPTPPSNLPQAGDTLTN